MTSDPTDTCSDPESSSTTVGVYINPGSSTASENDADSNVVQLSKILEYSFFGNETDLQEAQNNLPVLLLWALCHCVPYVYAWPGWRSAYMSFRSDYSCRVCRVYEPHGACIDWSIP